MKICFIDEAGDLGPLNDPPQPNDQPVLIIGGLIVDIANLHDLTYAFLDLKSQYFPRPLANSTRPLDRILLEIKGAEVRKNATLGSARQRHHAISLLDRIFGLLQRFDGEAGCTHINKRRRIALRSQVSIHFVDTENLLVLRPLPHTKLRHRHLHRRQPQQEQEHQRLPLDLHPEIPSEKISLPTDRRTADLRAQRQPCRPANLRHHVLCLALSHYLFCVLHRVRQQRPRTTWSRAPQTEIRTTSAGPPVPIQGNRSRPLHRRDCRL